MYIWLFIKSIFHYVSNAILLHCSCESKKKSVKLEYLFTVLYIPVNHIFCVISVSTNHNLKPSTWNKNMSLMWKNTVHLVSFNKQRLSIPLYITLCNRASSLIILHNSEDLVSNMYIIVSINRNHYILKDYHFCMSRILESTAGFSIRLENLSFQVQYY